MLNQKIMDRATVEQTVEQTIEQTVERTAAQSDRVADFSDMLLVYGKLALVLAGLWLLLVFLRRRAPARLGAARGAGDLEVLESVRLEGRRRLYLARARDVVVLLASSENGVQPLGEIDRAPAKEAQEEKR